MEATETAIFVATGVGERTDSSRVGASVPAFAQTNLFRSGQILFPSGQHLHSYTFAGNPIFPKAEYPRDINENLITTTMN